MPIYLSYRRSGASGSGRGLADSEHATASARDVPRAHIRPLTTLGEEVPESACDEWQGERVSAMSTDVHQTQIDWPDWLRRWDRQQEGYVPEREGRVTGVCEGGGAVGAPVAG